MTGLVSVDRDDDYVVQLKTQRQKTQKQSIKRLSINKSECKQRN